MKRPVKDVIATEGIKAAATAKRLERLRSQFRSGTNWPALYPLDEQLKKCAKELAWLTVLIRQAEVDLQAEANGVPTAQWKTFAQGVARDAAATTKES